MEIKIGDQVQLKIGGHIMLVDNINDFRADCIWTDLNGKVCRDNFSTDNLVRIRPDKVAK